MGTTYHKYLDKYVQNQRKIKGYRVINQNLTIKDRQVLNKILKQHEHMNNLFKSIDKKSLHRNRRHYEQVYNA